MTESLRPDATEALTQVLRERILVLDGAMGTLIQGFGPGETEFRGERFADWGQDVGGNSDLLNLTQPDMIRSIHRQYLEAGADILETNTFTATSIAQLDYGMQDLAHEINVAGARLAREVADELSTPDRPRFVAGSLGPDQPHRLDLARRQRPRRPQRQLRRARGGLPRAGPRAWSRAAPTCCWSRRSSTPSTRRPRSSRSRPSSRSTAGGGR